MQCQQSSKQCPVFHKQIHPGRAIYEQMAQETQHFFATAPPLSEKVSQNLYKNLLLNISETVLLKIFDNN